MKLKVKIKKAEWEALAEALQALYVADGDNYKLDVDDAEVAAEMRRARDREKVRADEVEEARKKLEEELEELKGDDAKKNKDIEAIEKTHTTKYNKLKGDMEKVVGSLKKHLEKALLESELLKIATEIFMKPGRDIRLLRERAFVDFTDVENPAIKVRDAEGKESSLTLADLKKETCENPDYADILIGSKATGSGGAGGNQGAGGSKQPKDMTEVERTKLYRENPAEFRRLFPTA